MSFETFVSTYWPHLSFALVLVGTAFINALPAPGTPWDTYEVFYQFVHGMPLPTAVVSGRSKPPNV